MIEMKQPRAEIMTEVLVIMTAVLSHITNGLQKK